MSVPKNKKSRHHSPKASSGTIIVRLIGIRIRGVNRLSMTNSRHSVLQARISNILTIYQEKIYLNKLDIAGSDSLASILLIQATVKHVCRLALH